MNAWLKHWGFSQDPFSKEIAAQELWLPSRKLLLVERLVEACATHSSALLVGEPGVGKTCMLRALQHRLPDAQYRLTYYCNATLGRRDFYRALCAALGLQPRGSAASVFSQVSACIQDLGESGTHPVLVLDESHMLHQEVLDHLHILLNFSWDSKSLLSVILVGLPELWDQLELRRNRSLYSRLTARTNIGSHTLEDTREYVVHRLRMAGRGTALTFAPEALELLHEVSAGSLRATDRLARLALHQVSLTSDELVDAAAMQKATTMDTRGS